MDETLRRKIENIDSALGKLLKYFFISNFSKKRIGQLSEFRIAFLKFTNTLIDEKTADISEYFPIKKKTSKTN